MIELRPRLGKRSETEDVAHVTLTNTQRCATWSPSGVVVRPRVASLSHSARKARNAHASGDLPQHELGSILPES